MKNRLIQVQLSVLLIIVLLFPAAQTIAADKRAVQNSSPVRIAQVQEAVVSAQLSIISTTEAVRNSTVASEVSGRVEKVFVKEGDHVKKGAPLIRLNSTVPALRLRGAIAGNQALEAKRVLAEKELERVGNLKNANSVAAKQYDEVYFNHKALTRELEKSLAEIERLKYVIEQQTVTSPFAGFIAEKHTQVGEWMNTGGGVISLVDLSSIIIMADLPEQHAVQLHPDSKITVVIKSLSETPIPAKLEAVLPRGNPVSRTFPIRIKLPNSKRTIKSGMEAVVTFDTGGKIDTLLIPKDAIVPSGSRNTVYTITQGKAFPVSVKVTGHYGQNAAVEGDLKPGQPVVIRGNERLRPGQTVHIIE